MADSPEARSTMENITIRSLEHISPQEKDSLLNQIEAVEKSAWPDELEAPRDKFQARIDVFSEGFIIAEVNSVVKGMSTAQLTNYDPNGKLSWNELTDNGYIRKSHNPEGNALYVVSVAVASDTQGLGLGSKLVDAQKELTTKLGKKYLFLGARVPGYDAYCKEHGDVTIEDYLKLRNEKDESVDPEIRFYMRRGLKPAKIIPHFEPDPPSRDFGVVMLWENS